MDKYMFKKIAVILYNIKKLTKILFTLSSVAIPYSNFSILRDGIRGEKIFLDLSMELVQLENPWINAK